MKNALILQEGGSTPAPPTPPVIRVVLLHKQGDRVILYFLKCMYQLTASTTEKNLMKFVQYVLDKLRPF